MIELSETSAGILLPVKAQAGAKRNAIVGTHAGMLKVAVTAVREKGKANEAILEVLSKQLQLSKNQITLTRGPTSPQKTFEITAITVSELLARIESCLSD